MALWELDTLTTKQLNRLNKIDNELQEMGLDGLDQDMMAEVDAEIQRRKGYEEEDEEYKDFKRCAD